MKLYCVQLDIAWEDKEANFRRVEALLSAARPERGSLVLLPEMFATGFSMNIPRIRDGGEQETPRFLAATARQYGVFMLGGLVAIKSNGRGSNQAVAFTPQGEELARYTKLQPFTLGEEARHYDAGTEPVVFPWHTLMVSPFVCYDLRFPEHFRLATRRGAQVLTVIANWPAVRIQHWITLLQARAIENQAYVAGVNRCGNDPKLAYNGRSLIISPQGEVLADAGNAPGVIHAEVNVDQLSAYRRDFPFLADMRG